MMEWEQIDFYLFRVKVLGGWIVKYEVGVVYNTDHAGMSEGWDWRTSICFVPDEGHYWKLKDEVK